MSELLKLMLMAILQGVTEFLPVSSSGHLALAGKLFGLDPDKVLLLGVLMHAGSFFAIVIFYFKLLLGFFKRDQLHLMLMVILATIPTGIGGVLLQKSGLADNLFSSPLITGMAFLITGMLLRMTDKKKLLPDPEQTVSVKEISWRQALIVGFVQLGALIPGISRSGSTIAAGIFCGIKREDAAAFSFLLALPAIGGATLLEVISMLSHTTGEQVSAIQIAVSVLFSFAASLGALTCVVNIVKKSKLSLFSWYMFALGIAVIIWQLVLLHGVK